MTKKPSFWPAERVDLYDFRYGIADYGEQLRDQLYRQVIGAGVLEGFRVEVLEQSGSNLGAIEIYNGRGISWSGQHLQDETGKHSERVELRSPSTEYWIEIELLWGDSDPDARYYWDSLVNNPDPIPDGQEVGVSRSYTRKTPLWRVVQPIRNNPTGFRSSGGYTPAHFSASNVNVLPLCVIRLDPSGRVRFGNPDTDEWGNDLISVLTSTGTKTFVKTNGYDEQKHYSDPPTNSVPLIYGRKTTDQRRRMFEVIVPPFVYGANEVVGSTYSDEWARDVKSMFDHLASQIGQVKNGASWSVGGESSMGQYHDGVISDLDPDETWVDLKAVYTNGSPRTSMTADPDQFMGCVFWITSGPWRGFYARVMGNNRTDPGTGKTRLLLSRQSQFPSRRDLPPTLLGASCLLVQDRQKNWMNPPCPNSGYRGLNELDNEVVQSRSDWWSGVNFKKLGSRLNANKAPVLTVAPPDSSGSDPDTGEPETTIWPRADVFESINEIRTKVRQAAVIFKGGTVLFRGGVFHFDSVPSGESAFEINSATGVTFEGAGIDRTSFSLTDHAGSIFSLSNCTDITFRDMTIYSKGTPVVLSGCKRITFERCVIKGAFSDLTTPTMDVGSGDRLVIKDCYFELYGTGFVGSGLSYARIENSIFVGSENATELSTVWNIAGTSTESYINNTFISGFGANGGVVMDRFTGGGIIGTTIKVNIASGATISSAKLRMGLVQRAVLSGLRFPRLSSDNNSGICLYTAGMTDMIIDDFWGEGCSGGISTGGSAGTCRRVILSEINVDAYGGSPGIVLSQPEFTLVDGFVLRTSGAGQGVYVYGSCDKLILDNVILSGTSLDEGIYFGVQSLFKQVAIRGFQCRGAKRGIWGEDISGGDGFLVDGAQVYESSIASFVFKFRSMSRFIFHKNISRDASGLGFSLDMTGCYGESFSFGKNQLYSFKRPFDIWSSSAGQLTQSGFDGNIFRGGLGGEPLVSIGMKEVEGLDVAASVFTLSDISMTKNKVYCSVGSQGGFLLSSLYDSSIDGNSIRNFDTYGIRVIDNVEDCSMSMNRISGGDSAPIASHNAAFYLYKPNSVSRNEFIGNRLTIGGDRVHAFFFGDGMVQNNISLNICSGNAGASQAFIRAYDSFTACVINGNRVSGTAVGIDSDNPSNNMISGNLFQNITNKLVMNFSPASSNNKGGMLIPVASANWSPYPTPAGVPGNPQFADYNGTPGSFSGNNLSMYNYCF